MPPVAALYHRILRAYGTDAGRTAARNFVWLAVLTVLTQLCGLGTVLYLTHEWSVATWGIFANALAVQSYLLLLGSGRIDRISIRDGAHSPENIHTVETTRLTITGTLSTLLFALVTVVVSQSSVSSDTVILMVLLAAGNIAACVNMRCMFDVEHRQPASAAVTLLSETLGLGALFVAVQLGELSLPVVGAIFAGKWTVGSVTQFLLYHATIRPWRWSWETAHLRQTLQSAWPLVVSGLFAMVPLVSGVFIVTGFHDLADGGIYGLAQRIAGAYLVFSSVVARIVQPHVAGPYGMSRSFIKKLVVFGVAFHVVALPLTLGLSALVIEYILKSAYGPAIVPTAILLLSQSLRSAEVVAGMYAITQLREKVILRANVWGAIVFIAGCLWWVPKGSYVACACLALVAAVVRLAIIVWQVTRSNR